MSAGASWVPMSVPSMTVDVAVPLPLQFLFRGQAEPAGTGSLGNVHHLDRLVENYCPVGPHDDQFIFPVSNLLLEPIEQPVEGDGFLARKARPLGIDVNGDGFLCLGGRGPGLGNLILMPSSTMKLVVSRK